MNNVQRFFKYYLAQLRANRRHFMLILLSAFLTIAAYYLFCTLIGVNPSVAIIGSKALFGFAFFVTVAVVVCKSFNDYHKPLIATRSMLLPVSRAHKFIYIFLTYIVLVPLLLGSIYFLQGVVASEIAGVEYNWSGTFMRIVAIMDSSSSPSLINFHIEFISTLLFFIMCAVVFRRLQLLFAVLIMVATSVVVLVAIVFYVKSFGDISAADGSMHMWGIAISDYTILVNSIFGALFVAAAWFRFRSLQIKK